MFAFRSVIGIYCFFVCLCRKLFTTLLETRIRIQQSTSVPMICSSLVHIGLMAEGKKNNTQSIISTDVTAVSIVK